MAIYDFPNCKEALEEWCQATGRELTAIRNTHDYYASGGRDTAALRRLQKTMSEAHTASRLAYSRLQAFLVDPPGV